MKVTCSCTRGSLRQEAHFLDLLALDDVGGEADWHTFKAPQTRLAHWCSWSLSFTRDWSY